MWLGDQASSMEVMTLSWMMEVMGDRSRVYKEDCPHAWMVLNLDPSTSNPR